MEDKFWKIVISLTVGFVSFGIAGIQNGIGLMLILGFICAMLAYIILTNPPK